MDIMPIPLQSSTHKSPEIYHNMSDLPQKSSYISPLLRRLQNLGFRHSYSKPPDTFLCCARAETKSSETTPSHISNPHLKEPCKVRVTSDRSHFLNRHPPASGVEQSLPRQRVSPCFLLTFRDPACEQSRPFCHISLGSALCLQGGVRGSRDNISGFSIGLNKGTMGLGKYEPG